MVKFYSMALKKSIEIPEKDCRKVTKSGRNFIVGTYKVGGVSKEAWRIASKN